MKTFLIILLTLSLPFLLKKILFGYVQWQANKLVKDLRKQSPENAKAIDDMHNLASDIRYRIKQIEKTDPEKAKKLRDKLDF